MDVNLINPFIDTFIYIMETTSSMNYRLQRPHLNKSCESEGPISGLIDISGDISGFISVTFSREAILKMVSNMFGEEMTEINDDVKDAVGEFVNMVCGQANNKFAQNGKNIKVEGKGIKDGEKHQLNSADKRPLITIPMKSDFGMAYLNVSF